MSTASSTSGDLCACRTSSLCSICTLPLEVIDGRSHSSPSQDLVWRCQCQTRAVLFPDGVRSDDLYALLGVGPQATAHEIRTGWRTQVGTWHPDRNLSAIATARTQAINGAHDILKDSALRRQYDLLGLNRSTRPGREARPAAEAAEAQPRGRSTAEEAESQQARARWAAYEAEWLAKEAKWAAEAEREHRRGLFYELEDRMYTAYSGGSGGERDLRGALALAVKAVEMLPQFLASMLQSEAYYRREAQSKGQSRPEWRPPLFRSAWTGLLLAPILQDEAALNRIASILDGTQALAPWCHLIDPARQSFRDVRPILLYVRAHPGTIQSQLGKVIGLDQPGVSEHCYWLAEAGSIRRAKTGRSYALYVP